MIPRIFVSYLKEDIEFSEQIQRLIYKLRTQGLSVVTFDDIKLGARFSTYTKQIQECNFVLCICTPKYKERADKGECGKGIVTDSVINQNDKSKFFPVLIIGDEETSFPIWARDKKYIDYRNESDEELMYFANAVNKYVEAYESKYGCAGEASILICNSDGTSERRSVVCGFRTRDTGDEYLVYTDGVVDENGDVVVHVSKIINDTELTTIEDGIEWERIKGIIWTLGMDSDFAKGDDLNES